MRDEHIRSLDNIERASKCFEIVNLIIKRCIIILMTALQFSTLYMSVHECMLTCFRRLNMLRRQEIMCRLSMVLVTGSTLVGEFVTHV